MICCTPATATSLRQDNMFVGSLMIATQAVCGGMLSQSISVTGNYPVGLSAAYGMIARPVYNYSRPRVRRPYHDAYHTYLGIFGI